MDKVELNNKVLNKVIAFKLLEILRDNEMIDCAKYKSVERKRMLYHESVIKNDKPKEGGN